MYIQWYDTYLPHLHTYTYLLGVLQQGGTGWSVHPTLKSRGTSYVLVHYPPPTFTTTFIFIDWSPTYKIVPAPLLFTHILTHTQFRVSDWFDKLLMFVGLIAAVVHGLAMPFTVQIFSDAVDMFVADEKDRAMQGLVKGYEVVSVGL